MVFGDKILFQIEQLHDGIWQNQSINWNTKELMS